MSAGCKISENGQSFASYHVSHISSKLLPTRKAHLGHLEVLISQKAQADGPTLTKL